MNKKLLSLVLSATVMGSMLLVGCGGNTDQNTSTTDEKTENALKVSMVTDVGGVNDQSFNQSAWEGLQRAQDELGITSTYQESSQEADYAPNIATCIDEENDLIFGIGFKMEDAIRKAASDYPQQKFAIIDSDMSGKIPEDVVGITFKEQEASYLVGVIAGKMTGTNKIGFVGGMEVPVIQRFQYGFMAGVKAANPDATIETQFVNSFADAAKGKAIAKAMYQNGVDVVFHAAGDSGTGVIEAAKEEDKYVIGVDRDQNDLAPKNVITSAVKRVDNAVFDVTQKLVDGTFDGGNHVVYGLAEGGVDIAPTTKNNVPEDILKIVDEYKEKIKSGAITPPGTLEEFEAMK